MCLVSMGVEGGERRHAYAAGTVAAGSHASAVSAASAAGDVSAAPAACDVCVSM